MRAADFAPVFPSSFVEAVKGKTIAVYGSGTAAQDVIRYFQARGCTVSFVLDANSPRTAVLGLSIFHPEDSRFSLATRGDCVVFVGIFNANVDVRGKTDELRLAGWTNVVDFLELHASDPKAFGDRYWLTARQFYARCGGEIDAAYDYWADAKSLHLFRQTLKLRLQGDDSELRTLDPHQYFPSDLPPLREPLRIIDCGACTGDTILMARELKIPLEAVALFEPDPTNFGHLVGHSRSWRQEGVELYAFPCGVGAKFEVLRFSSAMGAASNFSETGDLRVCSVSIDEVLPFFRPHLIKMDVEGAEASALLGAHGTIARYRPRLAVSAYHRPEDLWALARLIREWDLGYQLYLRQHRYRGFDLVLYAVPSP